MSKIIRNIIGNFYPLEGHWEGKKKKLSDADPEFAAFYKEKIAPHALFAEDSRIDHLNKFYVRLACSIPVCAISLCFIWKYLSAKYSLEDLFEIALAPFAACGVWCYFAVKGFNISIKSKIYSEIFKFFGDFKYYHQGLGLEGVGLREKFGIIPSFSSAETEDLIVGEYSGVKIVFEEWKLSKGRGRDTKTVFQGATIFLSFNKNFLGKTVVRRDKGRILNFTSKFFSSDLSGLEKVSLEDPEFEKKFEVFSSDQIEARYLITPALMNRLLNLTNFLGAESLNAGFVDNSLFMMFNGSKDLFEVGSMFEKTNLANESLMVNTQMKLIFELIDYLKISQKTGI